MKNKSFFTKAIGYIKEMMGMMKKAPKKGMKKVEDKPLWKSKPPKAKKKKKKS